LPLPPTSAPPKWTRAHDHLPGTSAPQLNPNNVYITKSHIKPFTVFGKAREDIDRRVDDYMKENNIPHSKRMALLNKERAMEYEKLSEEKKIWAEKARACNKTNRKAPADSK